MLNFLDSVNLNVGKMCDNGLNFLLRQTDMFTAIVIGVSENK